MSAHKEPRRITIKRTYHASAQDLWDLWTTKEGIESWWGPEGFATKVHQLDLRAGGELRYAITAIDPKQVAFMKRAGMPLTNECRISYTAVLVRKRISYTHWADFIPEIEPYEVATLVEFQSIGKTVRMVLQFDVMHSDEWTERAVMGHESQLGKLDRLLAACAGKSK